MSDPGFTIVVPTRDNPEICQQMLEALILQGPQSELSVSVVFLVNDTQAGDVTRLQETILQERFAPLQPTLLRATCNWPTVEENIRHTLGENLDAVGDHFLIVGNSDIVILKDLGNALEFFRRKNLDLLLIGCLNREVYDGNPVRQFYVTPRHLNPKNRLDASESSGPHVFGSALNDYGPVDYLSFIGCQIYSKQFFRKLCLVQVEFPEALYSIPIATLELTTRQEWAIGFWPEVVVVRVDHLRYGPNAPQHPPDWWIVKQRTNRGLSNHLLLTVMSSSLYLSPKAFEILVNSQTVAMQRGQPLYVFSNFLFLLVQQISNYVRSSANDASLRYHCSELRDIIAFGTRLRTVSIGLPAQQQELLSTWLECFSVVGDYTNQRKIDNLLSASSGLLTLLDTRPGMERWVAQLS